MTLEEAIKLLKQYQGYDPMFPDGETLKHAFDLTDETVDTLLTALRPVSREQVEKAWRSCKVCNGEMTLYQHTKTTKLFLNTFGESAVLVTECMACPPYADCCMKGISANSAFRINFCPECGRPLTDEAWDEMKNRLEKIKRKHTLQGKSQEIKTTGVNLSARKIF